MLSFLKRFAAPEDKEFLERNEVKVEYLSYNWTLNSQ